MTSESTLVRIATRSSPLAVWQSELVASRLRAVRPGINVDLVRVDTYGDRTQATNVALHTIAGQGIFVKEVELAILDGRADIAVHSAKDLPTQLGDGLVIAAIPLRDDARDGMVGSTIAALPQHARVATGSVRRRAQLAALRPDLRFHELRGNMHTRLAKAGGFDAIVVGVAGMTRLGLGAHVSEPLDPDVMLPMVGQGAVAVQCRLRDDALLTLLAQLDDPEHHVAVQVERAFLARLGSGCELPIAALAERYDGGWRLRALVASHDGSRVVRATVHASEPDGLGEEAADAVLAQGAAGMLAGP